MAHPQAGACAHVPHLHLPLIAPTSEKPTIWTPFDAEEGGVEVVRVAQGPHQSTCGRVPHLDGIVQPAAGQQPIWTPRDSIGYPTMATQQPGRSPAITRPNGHEGIGARAGE